MAALLTARARHRIIDVDLCLDLEQAPITVLFGPSGSGKTTLLRCLAGLDRPDAGSLVSFGDCVWDNTGVHVSVKDRGVGYVFQDNTLFPHLDVDANVAYGLHRVPRRERPELVAHALARAGASHLSGRSTTGLSGGEGQRVALARAIAPSPRLLLLDEPLSALDTPTRTRLRTELRSLLLASGIPTIVVTHDRAEALALGDQVVVLIDGRVRQVGAVQDVFSRPVDQQVADAVEVETVVLGSVRSRGDGLMVVDVAGTHITALDDPELDLASPVLVCIRAEEVALQPRDTVVRDSPRNHLPCTVMALADQGHLVRVDLDAGFHLAAYVTRPTREDLALEVGSGVMAAVKAPAVHLVARA